MTQICLKCILEFSNKHSYSNHKRWCEGRMEKTRIKFSKNKLGEKNPNWAGLKVGYHALHDWIMERKKKPEFCEHCKIKSPFDLANISQQYKRDVNDFQYLCRSCHMKKDGRLSNLHVNRKIKTL